MTSYSHEYTLIIHTDANAHINYYTCVSVMKSRYEQEESCSVGPFLSGSM